MPAGLRGAETTPSAVRHHVRGQRHRGNGATGQRRGHKHERGDHAELCPLAGSGRAPGARGTRAAELRLSCLLLQVIHLSGRFEIVSLVGTLNPEAHLHVCLSDAEGRTLGGHVLGGLHVFTTAEVVVGEAAELCFTREMDGETGFPELVVQPRSQAQ